MKPMISVTAKGSFKNTEVFLNNLLKPIKRSTLDKYGRMGVNILEEVTPKDTGKTAKSWSYTIDYKKNGTTISWYNDNITKDGSPIAIMLQYGHATNNGGYVKGKDYLNPRLSELFDKMAEDIWEEVMSK